MATDHPINNINHQHKSDDDSLHTFRVNMHELSESIAPTFETAIVRQIEKKLGLDFIIERDTGNVCFANNNDELREEFKTTFTPYDLFDYIYGVLHQSHQENRTALIKSESLLVPYPKDDATFWQLAKLGATIKQTYVLKSK